MKKLVLSLGMMFATVLAVNTASAQTEVKMAGPEISIDKDVHDYGQIKKDANGDCFFTITNTGNEPLTITKAKGSCGCTVPDWPREPIAPGKTAKMKVTYATNRVGKINKSVTITSNSSNAPTKVVRIKGEVLAPAPAATTPAAPAVGN
jgi:hypothetical protein